MYKEQILNYKDKDTGSYLIHYACESGVSSFLARIKHYHGGPFLLNQLKLQTKSGKTPVHIAAQQGNSSLLTKILKFIERSDDPQEMLKTLNSKTHNGSLPLHLLLSNARLTNNEK